MNISYYILCRYKRKHAPFSEEKLFRKTEDIKNDVVIINLYISKHVVAIVEVVRGNTITYRLVKNTAHAIYESLLHFIRFSPNIINQLQTNISVKGLL